MLQNNVCSFNNTYIRKKLIKKCHVKFRRHFPVFQYLKNRRYRNLLRNWRQLGHYQTRNTQLLKMLRGEIRCHWCEIRTFPLKNCRVKQSSNILLLRLFTLPQGLTSQMPVGQMPVGGATVSGREHQTDTQGRASLNMWSAQCQGLRRRQHRTEHRQRTHTQSQDRN